MCRCVRLMAAAVVAVAGARPAAAQGGPTTLPAAEVARLAARRTPWVQLFEACRPSVVTVLVTRTADRARPLAAPSGGAGDGEGPNGPHVERGSGFVIRSDGFVLTVAHVLRRGGACKVYLDDGRGFLADVVARDDSMDVAVLKIDSRDIFQPLRLGRSDDLMVGEATAVLGNPFGFGLSLGPGVITGLERKTKTDFAYLGNVIQTDAGINPGMSGGPLVNAFGEVIGMAVSRREDAMGIGFATAIEVIRAALPQVVAPEQRYGFVLGIEATPGLAARVLRVAPGSPAEEAGVRADDVITAIDGKALRSGIDFYLALVGRAGGQKVRLRLLRGEKRVVTTVTLGSVPLQPAVEPGAVAEGLDFELFRGRWDSLPDFARLKPAATRVAPAFALGDGAGQDGFALRFRGYVRVPADGVYAFYLKSDDGSRLHLGERLVVDNDGTHPSRERRGFAALKAGLHPVTVTYFETVGEEELVVSYEGPGVDKQPIPTAALCRPKPQPKPAPAPTTQPGG